MITEYIIVNCETLRRLIQVVNENIVKGYQPFGSMTFVPTLSDNSGKSFVQPMVKYGVEE